MDKFRSISTADIGSLEVWIKDDHLCIDLPHKQDRALLSVAQATALHEWLGLALPIKAGLKADKVHLTRPSKPLPLCTCESIQQCRGSDWAAKDGMRCSQSDGATETEGDA